MRNYAGTCKGICSYNLVYNFLIQLLPLKSSLFVVHFSNAFWHGISKAVCRMKLFLSLQSSTCHIQGCENMFLLVSLSKSKFFTRVVLVSFVQHSYCTCAALVSIVSQSRCLCCVRVACVSLVLLVSGARGVN